MKTLLKLKELQFIPYDAPEDEDTPADERNGEWRMYPQNHKAHTEIGEYGYFVVPSGHLDFPEEDWGKVYYWGPRQEWDYSCPENSTDSVLSAIQAMRNDYHRRILSCLELPEPPR